MTDREKFEAWWGDDTSGPEALSAWNGWQAALLSASKPAVAHDDEQADLAFSVYSGLNALRWLLNITAEFDRKDVRTRQAARLLDEYMDSFGKTNRELLEDMWKTLYDKLPDDGRISEYLRAHDAAGRALKDKEARKPVVVNTLKDILAASPAAPTQSAHVPKPGRKTRQEKINESREIVAARLQHLERPLNGRCAASNDGECSHSQCPQLRDGEPEKSGRHCPLDVRRMPR
ncbi:hypothetical protein [Paraburkholderia elongata]|nr:hypothetical protein [Paraburkholderia elongata]